MKKHELGIISCDICQEIIVKEKEYGLHYPKVDYHVSCVCDRLRKHKAIPEAVANAERNEKEAVV